MLIGTIFLGLLLTRLTINIHNWRVYAQSSIKEEGNITVSIESNYDLSLQGSIILRNTGTQPVVINKYSFGLPFFQLNNLKLVKISRKNVLVDIYVENDSTFFRIKSSKTDPIVLKKNQSLSFSFKSDIRNGIKEIGKSLKVFSHPYIDSPYTIKLRVHKSLPNLSYYPHVLEGDYQVYNISNILSEQERPIILFFSTVNPIIDYTISTNSSYFAPISYRDCIKSSIIQAETQYVFYDNQGYLLPKAISRNYSSILLREDVDLKCLNTSQFNSKNIFVGFSINPVDKTLKQEIWRFSLGKLEFYKNNTFISSGDKYGIFHIPIASCKTVEECVKMYSVLGSNYNIELIYNSQVSNPSSIHCTLKDIENATATDLKLHRTFMNGIVIENISNSCLKIYSVLCNPIELLSNMNVLIFAKGKYALNNKCDTNKEIFINKNSVKYQYNFLKEYNRFLISLGVFLILTSVLSLFLYIRFKNDMD